MVEPLKFRIGNYVITPRDSAPGRLFNALLTPPVQHWVGTGVVIALLGGLFAGTDWETSTIVFLVALFSVFFWNIDGRIPAGFALACLVVIPVLLASSRQFGWSAGEAWAEEVAVWAYFGLVLSVAKQAAELRRDRSDETADG